jgi:hypothetical protein
MTVIKRLGFPDITDEDLKPTGEIKLAITNWDDWEDMCFDKDWDRLTDGRIKPRIVELVESFECQYPSAECESTACMAVATYLFGPFETDDELTSYHNIVRTKIRNYRTRPIQ